MFELVLLLVLLLVQVYEVVCDPLLAPCVRVPADLEGVTGDVADADLVGDRQLVQLPDPAVRRRGSWEREQGKGSFNTMRCTFLVEIPFQPLAT